MFRRGCHGSDSGVALAGALAVALILTAWPLSALPADGAEVRPGLVIPAHQLVHVVPSSPDETVFILPWSVAPGANPPMVETVETAAGDVVFTGPPGWYAVMWFTAGERRSQGQVFVQIVERGPVPPGPNPPGPGPSPVVPDAYGVGKAAYDAAVAVGQPASAQQLSAIYRRAAADLRTRTIADPEALVDAVNQINRAIQNETNKVPQVERWSNWRATIKAELTTAWTKDGHNTQEGYANVLDEIAAAMALVK